MAYRIPNQYHSGASANPFAAAANGINNIAWAMMKNAKSPEELENMRAQAELRHAQMAQAQAMTAEHQAKAEATAAGMRQQQAALPQFMMGAAGIDQPTYDKVQAARSAGYGSPGVWGVRDTGEQSVPMTRQDVISDEQFQRLNGASASMNGALATGDKANPDQLAKGQRGFMQNGLISNVMAGGALPANITQIAQMDRAFDGSTPVFSTGANGVTTNSITGMRDETGDTARANIGKDKAAANNYNAAAGEHTAGAGLKNAEAKLMDVTLDDGTVIQTPQKLGVPASIKQETSANAEEGRNARAANKVPGGAKTQKTVPPHVMKLIKESVKNEFDTDTQINGQDENAINEWASHEFSDPKSSGYNNAVTAAKLAIARVYPNGHEESGWFSGKRVVGKGGSNREMPNGSSPVAQAMVGAAPKQGSGVAPLSVAGVPNGPKLGAAKKKLKFDKDGNLIP